MAMRRWMVGLAAAFALPLLAILALDLARQLRTRGAGASTA